MFNTLFQMEDLTKNEFQSVIWSNPVEDDFISAMCALMDFVDYESSKPQVSPSDLSLCNQCGCMTKTIDGYCGKCKWIKPSEKSDNSRNNQSAGILKPSELIKKLSDEDKKELKQLLSKYAD